MTADNAAPFARLGEFVSKLIKETGVPGVAVGMLHQGEMQAAGYGVTSAENPLPVTDQTYFQIGSISKTFTTTAVLRLVEMGKLELDAPVQRTIPEFRVADEDASVRVTLRQLLTHMGGWDGDLFHDTGPGDDALPRYIAAMAELPQLAPLGTIMSYNNSGFSVAGRLIELATGRRYEAALKELVLGPLGMEQTTFDPIEVMTRRFVVGHDASPQGAQVLRPWPLPRAIYPAGGVISHVQDLLRYARFHLGDGTTEGGERLLSEASMAAMRTPQVLVWGRASRSVGWQIDEAAGVRQVYHGGGTLGHSTVLVLVPEHGLAVTVLTNALQGAALHRRATRCALTEYLGVESPPEPKPMAATPEELAAYVGRYTRYGGDAELGMLRGQLVGSLVWTVGFPTRDVPPLPSPPPMTLGLCEPDRLLALDGPAKGTQIDVFRRADGSIGWLRSGTRLHRRQG